MTPSPACVKSEQTEYCVVVVVVVVVVVCVCVCVCVEGRWADG